MVGVAGFEPATSCSQGRRDDQTSLHPSGDARNRTVSPTLARRGRYLSYSSPRPWPGPALRLARARVDLCRPGWRLAGGAHAMEISIFRHVHRNGGAAQGPQESNPHYARVGAGPPIRWLIPINENRPLGFPCERLPEVSLLLPGSPRVRTQPRLTKGTHVRLVPPGRARRSHPHDIHARWVTSGIQLIKPRAPPSHSCLLDPQRGLAAGVRLTVIAAAIRHMRYQGISGGGYDRHADPRRA